MSTEIIEQISHTYIPPYKNKRISCRAIIIEDGRILLSHEAKGDIYMSPGGGLEENETNEECVEREVLEETGCIVKAVKPFVTVNEYCYDTLYVNRYFICEITGTGKACLTETEKYKKMEPEWVDIGKALEIFGAYSTLTPDHASLYLREFTILGRINLAISSDG